MDSNEVVFVVDPIEEEIEKFQEVLVKGVGLTVVAIADHKTPFPTIVVPQGGEMAPYIYLCAGWNLLVGTDSEAIRNGIKSFRPESERKPIFGPENASDRIVSILEEFVSANN